LPLWATGRGVDVRSPVDRRRSTFDELVDEWLASLEEHGWLFVDCDEDAMLADLAAVQRETVRSLQGDAMVAACWRYWLEHSRHAGEWRRRSL
jgi:hypothetical protein